MLCYYNIDERKKKNDSLLGPLSVWSLHILLCLHVFSDFLPHTKGVSIRWTGMSKLSLSEFGCEYECALQWKGVLSRSDLTLHSELLAQAQAIHNLELE